MKLECRQSISPAVCGGISSSFFSPFFRSPGAGVTGTRLSTITSAIFIPLLTALPAPPAPGETDNQEANALRQVCALNIIGEWLSHPLIIGEDELDAGLDIMLSVMKEVKPV